MIAPSSSTYEYDHTVSGIIGNGLRGLWQHREEDSSFRARDRSLQRVKIYSRSKAGAAVAWRVTSPHVARPRMRRVGQRASGWDHGHVGEGSGFVMGPDEGTIAA